ncbi:hypothetical protein HYZ99_02850 [Candidatus Peregrinibacteria bacterium]|nr:hypothetical protein [Candidatus Peregrinibacteria bacterium]
MTAASRKIFTAVLVVALIGLVFLLDMKRREAEARLAELSLQLGEDDPNAEQNREQAKRIIDQVSQLIALPDDVEPTVASIVDVEVLRSRNAFYNKAENGDYLLVTTDRAILYDPDADIILDVAPVQIQPAAEGGANASAAGNVR